MSKLAWITGCLLMLAAVPPADAFIVINEFLADPAAGLAGDANADGVRSSSEDEFVELFNQAPAQMNLTGWRLEDAAGVKHVFPSGSTIGGLDYLVVFGGGTPSLPGVDWQTASSGGLILNNGGDTISLFDENGLLKDEVVYGSEGGGDQSLSRYPEGGKDWMLHSLIEGAEGALFSPGAAAVSREEIPRAAVPEFPPVVYFSMAGLFQWARVRLGMTAA